VDLERETVGNMERRDNGTGKYVTEGGSLLLWEFVDERMKVWEGGMDGKCDRMGDVIPRCT